MREGRICACDREIVSEYVRVCVSEKEREREPDSLH